MSVIIKEVQSKSELKQFVSFPGLLYKDVPQYVPPIFSDEINVLSIDKNPALKNCTVQYWIAYKDGKPAGRIAGIINNEFIEKWAKRYARFGWVDFIDDEEVSKLLFETAEKWAIKNGMDAINGPLGFTDFDPEGLLIEGFDELATIIERYNFPYYSEHIEKLGYKKDADWFEYQINIPSQIPANIKRISDYVLHKHQLKVVRVKNLKEIEKYADGVFKLLNELYGLMYGFVPITEDLKRFYLKRYFPLLDPRLMAFVVDSKDQLVAFGITMPSYSELFKQAGGNRLKLAWLKYSGKAIKTDIVDMYFIGVLPEYLQHGLSSVLISSVGQTMIDLGFKKAETNIEFESNEAVQSLWKHFDYRQHKRRRCYLKAFASSSRMEDNI